MKIFRDFIKKHNISLPKIFGFNEIDNSLNFKLETKSNNAFKDLSYSIRYAIKDASYEKFDTIESSLCDIENIVDDLQSTVNKMIELLESYQTLIFEYEYMLTTIFDYEKINLEEYATHISKKDLINYYRLKKIKGLLNI